MASVEDFTSATETNATTGDTSADAERGSIPTEAPMADVGTVAAGTAYPYKHLRWRTGRKVGRTIYVCTEDENRDYDILIGVMDSPALAAEAVECHNARLHSDGPSDG